MIIKELKKISISDILIVALLIIILLQKCSGGNSEHPTAPQITKDTVWVQKSSTITTKPQLIKSIPYAVPIDRWNTEYLPDSNYVLLIKQYETLVRELLAKNVSSDSIKIDSIGHIYILDTISKNQIVSRTTHYNLKYPVITNTITLPAPNKRQLYIGMGIGGTEQDLINKINIGLLYKNKQDVMFGPNISLEQNGNLSYGIQAFWKIKLHK